jgi:hypothetical protein
MKSSLQGLRETQGTSDRLWWALVWLSRAFVAGVCAGVVLVVVVDVVTGR